MNKLTILLLLGLLTFSAFAANTCTAAGGKCCCTTTTDSDTVNMDTGVATCVAGSATNTCAGRTSSQTIAAATCNAEYKFATDKCEACPRGWTGAGGTAATCTVCAQDQVSTAAGTACASKTGNPTGEMLNCKVFGQLAATSCIIPKDGYKIGATAASVVPCDQGQYSIDGAACAAVTTPAAGAFLNCKAFSLANATKCAVAKTGFVATADGSGVHACATNCDECDNTTPSSNPLPGTCTKAKAGFYIKTVGTTKTIEACADGCVECAMNTAATPALECKKAKAGWSLSATFVLAACTAGQGTAGADGHTDTACVACDKTTKFCATCSQTTVCKTCIPGYTINATTGVCTQFSGTKHATCKAAQGSNSTDCQECDATVNFRTMETDSSNVAKAAGECKCMAGYGDKQALAAPAGTVVCGSCGDNAASCTFSATGIATVTCKDTFIVAGTACAAKAASAAPAGFFYDSTNSVFKTCPTNCTTCTASVCTSCKPKDSATYTEPSSTNSAYPHSFVGLTRQVVNGSCLDACPSSHVANSARTDCVSGSATTSTGSASGVFAIFALIASLFIIF